MHTVGQMLRGKERERDERRRRGPGGGVIVTIPGDASALEAARRMNEHRIGALVVVDGAGDLAGIVTERDILVRLVAGERDPGSTRVREVMTPEVVTCRCDQMLNDVRETMRRRRIRHVPVTDGCELVGMVSIGDLNAAANVSLSETIQSLEAYISQG